ncbi:response regulator [Neorhizobium sp. P12A]|uniref:response regulator transcription factor n=1 Tax=Rhizobium/Agrobacterium group TaxID=227290 RepID=UPI00104ADCCE|nr:MULTISPECIES: response regulator [Rhizobium/Agrobacterium group]KAA0695617.1 response regulator [Neorhizobium sp. P12A]TCR70989.1 response regulator receiver domain-containing protein [Rhizobium sp. BK376]
MTERFVCLVDDDDSVRESLPVLLRVLGFGVRSFASATEFLHSPVVEATECLILDVAMPGMTGPELHRELARNGMDIPVLFITAQSDAGIRGPLIEQGAVECLYKPFSDIELSDALDLVFKKPTRAE